MDGMSFLSDEVRGRVLGRTSWPKRVWGEIRSIQILPTFGQHRPPPPSCCPHHAHRNCKPWGDTVKAWQRHYARRECYLLRPR